MSECPTLASASTEIAIEPLELVAGLLEAAERFWFQLAEADNCANDVPERRVNALEDDEPSGFELGAARLLDELRLLLLADEELLAPEIANAASGATVAKAADDDEAANEDDVEGDDEVAAEDNNSDVEEEDEEEEDDDDEDHEVAIEGSNDGADDAALGSCSNEYSPARGRRAAG